MSSPQLLRSQSKDKKKKILDSDQFAKESQTDL